MDRYAGSPFVVPGGIMVRAAIATLVLAIAAIVLLQLISAAGDAAEVLGRIYEQQP